MSCECVILADSPGALVELCGISVLERLLRTLQRCGFKKVTIVSGTPCEISEYLARPSWARADLGFAIRERTNSALTPKEIVDLAPAEAEQILVLNGAYVLDARLLRLLLDQEKPAALVDSAVPSQLKDLVATAPETNLGILCGAIRISREWASNQNVSFVEAVQRGVEQGSLRPLDVAAQPAYLVPMRRAIRPCWFPAPSSAGDRRLAERILLDAAQKGTMDIPAYAHAPIETFLVSKLCRTSITPNQLTIFSNIVGWTATVLFATGRLGWGLILALIVGVVDGLDGKQARVKVETTQGGKLEHIFDAIFEISWWTALAYYFQSSGELPGAFYYLFALIVAEAIDLVPKNAVQRICGRLIEELSLFDRIVRLLAGRRNIYVWILTIGFLFGITAQAYQLLPWWAALTAVIHIPRAIWAITNRRKTGSSERGS